MYFMIPIAHNKTMIRILTLIQTGICVDNRS